MAGRGRVSRRLLCRTSWRGNHARDRPELFAARPDGERADAGRTYRAPTRPWRKPDLDQPWHGESTSRARQPGYAVGLLHRAGDYHHADADGTDSERGTDDRSLNDRPHRSYRSYRSSASAGR